jgi:hypothetical protein
MFPLANRPSAVRVKRIDPQQHDRISQPFARMSCPSACNSAALIRGSAAQAG